MSATDSIHGGRAMDQLPTPTLISVGRPSALLLVAQLGGWDIQSATTSTAVIAVVPICQGPTLQ